MQSDTESLLAPEYPCPWCGANATLQSGCPGCGRAPNPVAAEVIGLDGRIAALFPLVETARRELEAARRVHDERAGMLHGLQHRRNGLLARIHAERLAVAPAAPVPVPVPAVGQVAARPEASTRTVQNLLFILGGLLLGTAAIVFTTIAWATFGMVGRAAILGVVTTLALAAPLVALRRRLRATAETFAALGLLLVVLDGYAAWYVDLLGVAAMDPARYAGLVALLATLIAGGYGWATGLTGPRLGALLLAQPVLPLLLARQGAYGTALVLAGVAAVDLIAARFPLGARTGQEQNPVVRTGLRALAWLLFGGWLIAAFAVALFALIPDEDVPGFVAPTALLLDGVLLVAASVVARNARLQAAASGAFVVLFAVAAVRPVVEYGDDLWLVTATVVLGAIAAVVYGVLPRLPEAVRPGLRAGALVVLLGSFALLAATTLLGAVVTLAEAPGHYRIDASVDWQLPLAVVVLPLVVAPLLPMYVPRLFLPAGVGAPGAGGMSAGSVPAGEARHWGGGWRGWHDPIVVAAVLGVLALPFGVTMPVLPAAVLDLALGAVLLLTATRERFSRSVLVRAVPGAVLVLYALTMTSSRPLVLAVLLPLAVVLGVTVAAAAHGHHVRLGASALGAALLGVPFAAVTVLAAVTAGGDVLSRSWWSEVPAAPAARLTFAAGAVLLLAVAAVRRWWPAYLAAAGVAFGLVMLFAGLPLDSGTDAGVLYAVAALLVVAVAAAVRHLLACAPPEMRGRSVMAGSDLRSRPTAAEAGAVGSETRGPEAGAEADAVVPGAPAASGAASPGVQAPAFAHTASAVAAAGAVAPGAQAPAYAGAALHRRATWGQLLLGFVGGPLAFAVLLGVADAVWTVIAAPYSWLGLGWSERPTGTGLSPDQVTLPVWSQVAAVALLIPVVVLAVLIFTGGRRRRALLGGASTAAVAVLVGLAAAGAPWPAIPAVSLVLGVTALLVSGWVPRTGLLLVPVGIVLKGAGLAGASPRPGTTLAALGLSLVAGVVIGVTGRWMRSRLTGWLGAVVAAIGLAGTTGAAADLPLRLTALIVLGVAVAALTLGALLRRVRPAEAGPVEVAAHATAVVAFLLVVGGDLRYAASVALLWGIAVGVRAIFGPWRRALGLVAAGSLLLAWWLLLASANVGVWEAYTLPTALVAAVVGLIAARHRPALSSWRAYAVAVAAALLPSLAAVLLGDASWQRRLLLGIGAVVLVIGGAVRRRQSPVVLGGGTLLILSLTEVVRVWDLLPRWLPFAVGGVLLLTLAITYERRRRDLARLRAAVGRMN